MYHLEGVTRGKVRLRPPDEKANKAAIFEILCSVFGEGPTSTQALRTFFEHRQKERESIQEYSHALLLLLSCVEHLDLDGVHDKDKLLWDQFPDNLKDLQLRRDIKCWARDYPTKNFQQIREEAQHWVDKDSTPQRRAAVHEATAGHLPCDEITCDEVKGSADLRKVVNELTVGQKFLAENLQKFLTEQIKSQQAALERQQQATSQLSMSTQQWWHLGCYGCDSRSHIRRHCPNNRHDQQGGSKSKCSDKELPE